MLLTVLAGCQSTPPAVEETDMDQDVCVGDAILLEPGKELDLEQMAREVDCP